MPDRLSFLDLLQIALMWGLKPPDARADSMFRFSTGVRESRWWVVFWRIAGVTARYGSRVAHLRPFTGWVGDFDTSVIADAPLVLAEGMSAGVRVFWHPTRNLVGAAVEVSNALLREAGCGIDPQVRDLMRKGLETMAVTPPHPSVLNDMRSLVSFARELGTMEAIEFKYTDAPQGAGG